MTGGADSIDDLGLLWHDAIPTLFGAIRPPYTLESFLRSVHLRNVLQPTGRVRLSPALGHQSKTASGHGDAGSAFALVHEWVPSAQDLQESRQAQSVQVEGTFI